MNKIIKPTTPPHFFNADDFGMGKNMTEGILHAAQLELIQSTSLCVTGLQSDAEIISALKRLPTSIEVGLHISFTDGHPCSGDKNLAHILKKDTSFLPGIQALCQSDQLSPTTFENEIIAQIHNFGKIVGRNPAHLDSHQYFLYLSPPAFTALLCVSEKMQIPIRSPKPFVETDRLERFKKRLLERYKIELPFSAAERAQVLNSIFSKSTALLRSNDVFIEYSSTSGRSEESSLDFLNNEPIEVVCHPRLVHNETQQNLEM